MLDRSKVILRALDSFGIAGQLSDQSEVFYTSLFSTKHLGRVSDLLCARLEPSGVDEFQLRFSVLLSIFEACYGVVSKSETESHKGSAVFSSPLSLECGIDEEKVAIGIGFTLNPTISLNTDGLSERISKSAPKGKLEELLKELRNHSDLLFVKNDPLARRIEVVALIGLASHSDSKSEILTPLEVLTIDGKTAPTTPKPKFYSELGDLNYPVLLALEDFSSEPPGNAGDILEPGAPGSTEQSVSLKQKAKAKGGQERNAPDKNEGLENKLLEESAEGEDSEDGSEGEENAEEDGEESSEGSEEKKSLGKTLGSFLGFGKKKKKSKKDKSAAQKAAKKKKAEEDARLKEDRQGPALDGLLSGSEESGAEDEEDAEGRRQKLKDINFIPAGKPTEEKKRLVRAEESKEENEERVHSGKPREEKDAAIDSKSDEEKQRLVRGGKTKLEEESVVKGRKEDEAEGKRVRGETRKLADVNRVRGESPEDDEDILVRGKNEKEDQEKRVRGTKAQLEEQTLVREKRPDEDSGDDEEKTVRGGKSRQDEKITVRGKKDEEEEKILVRGEEDEEEEEVSVRGGKKKSEKDKKVKGWQEPEEELIRIKGSTDQIKEDAFRVSAKEKEGDEEDPLVVQGRKAKKPSLWRVKRLEGDSDPEGQEDEAPLPKQAKRGPGFLGRAGRVIRNLIGIFGRTEEEEVEAPLPVPPVAEEPEAPAKAATPDVIPPPSAEPVATGDPGALESDAKKLMHELHGGGLDHVLRVAQWEALSVKREIKNPKAGKWVDNLMGSLLAERSRLAELGKKVHLSVRLKEMEFKDKLSVLQEEVRKRDAAIVQKTAALARAKDNLSKVTETNEKLKVIAQNSEEDIHYKQKYDMTYKMLELSKEENAKISQRADELKAQLNTALANSKSSPAAASQMLVLQGKYERLFKQAEEFKKANRQLMERLNEPRRAAPSAGSEEIRKKIETAMKLITQEKQEKQAIKGQLFSSQQEQNRLREEIKKLQLENRHLLHSAQQAKKPQGGSSTPPQAA
jgi:hypothetical protein